MNPDQLDFNVEDFVDYNGTGDFDRNDLASFDEGTLFASQYTTDYGSTGLTPAWPTLDTPGRYPRNDSSVTAIMANNSSHKDVKPRSHQSSTSPDSSSQDSPASSQSSGRRKRKSPTSQDTAATENTKVTSPSQREGPLSLSPTYDTKRHAALRGKHVLHEPLAMASAQTPEMAYHEQSVENISSAIHNSNFFDFESAASSPGGFGNGMNAGAFEALTTTPRTTGLMQDTPRFTAAEASSSKPAKFFLESRENSPMAAMTASHHASPVALFSTESPQNMQAVPGDGTFWPQHAGAPQFSFNAIDTMTPSPVAKSSIMSSPRVAMNAHSSQPPYSLSIKPFHAKSRVETQIPVTLTMSPMPAGVTKLHLQAYTISKPKLLAKETLREQNTLELYADVVCTSAMQKPHLKENAMKRAAGLPETPVKREVRRSSAGDAEEENTDPNDPLNGGNVKICPNCVNRERKRAARKKAKKQEDEDHWSQYEQDRIVVFNTNEYKDWSPATMDGLEGQQNPDGAMTVEVPMRIACYCRHQNEKLGFQVIFTIKDFQDRVLAQTISDSILITDDHKTQPTAGGPIGNDFNFGTASGYNSPELPSASFQQHRPYHSTNDLQALQYRAQQQSQQGFHGMSAMSNDPSMMMQASSTAVTPRNLSRPASPTFQAGSSKRRKGSSVHVQIPANLRMTQRNPNTSMPGAMGSMTAGPMSAGPVMSSHDPSFGMTPMSAGPYASQPPTPNSNAGYMSTPINRTASNDNMQMYQFYSTPHSQNPSRGPSRVPSPVMSRPTSRTIPQHQVQQPPMQQSMNAQTMQNMSFSPEAPQRPRPTVTRVNPSEGPLSGNIQVDIFGTGFYSGVVVYFGDNFTPANVWNEGALIAVVPAGTTAGPVEVRVQDPRNPMDIQQGYMQPRTREKPLFFYKDNQDSQLWEMFGKVMFQQQYGQPDLEQVKALLGPMNGRSYAYGGAQMPMNYQQMPHGQQRQMPAFAGVHARGTTEDALLELLNVIDMNDSPFAANFDLRLGDSGITMLSLASGLGYTRLVAGLVARGATVDVRDRCGYTPLMLAAMRGHRQIVRLLARRGADPTMRNRVGCTAADLAGSAGIAVELEQTAQHVRQRSIGGTPAFGSRANSVAFAEIPYLPLTLARSSDASLVTASDDSEAVEDIEELPLHLDAAGIASRRGSLAQQASRRSSRRPSANIELPMAITKEQAAMMLSPMAAMTAWHNQLLAQMNRLQQSVSDMQFAMPNLQDSMMVRRFSSMMPFSAGTPPPPYEEKDSSRLDELARDKKAGIISAAAEAALDDACEQKFGCVGTVTATASAVPSARSETVEQGKIMVDHDIQVSIGKKAISKEQQDQLRLAHLARLKSGRSDWKVWVIWLPLLVLVALLMMRSMLTQPSRVFPGLANNLGLVRSLRERLVGF